MSRWLPPQDPMTRPAGVGAGSGVEDDGTRMTMGYYSRAINRSFFPGTKQGRVGAPKGLLPLVPNLDCLPPHTRRYPSRTSRHSRSLPTL